MMKKMLLLMLLLSFAVEGWAQKSNLASDLQAVVAAERAFARTATEKGIHDSFLAFIADDGILFRPQPVNGKQWFAERPSRPGLLTWQPVYADISAAGDMGITTGPWEFRAKGPEDTPLGYGEFATVWKKQPDGTWKFAIDIGIEHDRPTAPAVAWTLPANFNRKKTAGKANAAVMQTVLLALDEEFSKASVAQGAAKGFLDYAADDIHLLRNGSFPIIGKKDMSAALAAKAGTVSWQPAKSEVSSSGDLGYTYGSFEFKGSGAGETESGSYMRVWKKQADGKWKVVLDIFNEQPKS
jgi:ketosteroid isomerase-like protein